MYAIQLQAVFNRNQAGSKVKIAFQPGANVRPSGKGAIDVNKVWVILMGVSVNAWPPVCVGRLYPGEEPKNNKTSFPKAEQLVECCLTTQTHTPHTHLSLSLSLSCSVVCFALRSVKSLVIGVSSQHN